jgi:dihydroorotase
MIDPHVHLRDWNGKDKETVLHGLLVARKAGFQAVFDMPNTNPAIVNKSLVEERLALASAAIDKIGGGISYHLYLGLTKEDEQIKEMIDCYNLYFPKCIGLKMFAGQSTGNMGIVELADQEKVFKSLAKYNYKGLLAVHAEKESLLRSCEYIEGQFETHSLARPPQAEVESIKDIIAIAKRTGYQGRLHICHVSTAEGIEILTKEKQSNPLLTFGITPHHALFTSEDAKCHDRYLKMNPPLRSERDRKAVVQAIREGNVDWIESDHAPHLLSDKEKGASGIPGFKGMLVLYDYLVKRGVNESQLRKLFGENVCKAFNINIGPITLNKDNKALKEDLSYAYLFDPYRE